ncbi:MAG: glutamine amidotransferase [Clostridia bacterium]|nr:glutamine amidotransferase [Clostridia bacterium]
MELEIVHLYHDLLNTYGDDGNIKLIKMRAEKRGINVNIKKVSVGDSIGNTDILFLGGGQEYEQTLACEDILKSRVDFIKGYTEDGGVGLFICGGYQLMGEFYADASGKKVKGASVLPIHSEAGEGRFTGNIIVRSSLETLVGFENHSGRTFLDGGEALGEVLFGNGNNGKDKTEGIIYKNAVGTYMHGPLLSKNPALCDDLIRRAMIRKYGSCILEPLEDEYELLAKQDMIKKLLKEDALK